MPSSMQAAIVGAAGYAGAELAVLLSRHPHIDRVAYLSRTLAGQPVAAHIPALRGETEAIFAEPSPQFFEPCEVVFFATPHGVAMHAAAELLEAGKVVIDMSPDFRLRDMSVFKRWYGDHASPDLLSQAAYGLTEAARDRIREANLIACPGCHATAAELALIPLAAAGILEGSAVIDSKSGVSGAGRRAEREDLLFAEQSENFKAYAVDGHRHRPEIEQAVAEFGGAIEPVAFVPHLLPASRGIYATVYVTANEDADCMNLIRERWKGEMFIDVVEAGVPELAHVARTNRVQLSARRLDNGHSMIIAALDNLQKGAAGQAVQNMNTRFGLSEDSGLAGARRLQ